MVNRQIKVPVGSSAVRVGRACVPGKIEKVWPSERGGRSAMEGVRKRGVARRY